ncbi:MAG: transcriptional regulator [Spirochaetaceae bacterium]|nr:transcriptional regulator [Spirochaetaceae bacterium]
MSNYINQQAEADFYRAYRKGRFNLTKLFFKQRELLPFNEVQQLVKAKDQSYLGIRSVALSDIVGSEERADDFSEGFWPKNAFLKTRWVSVSKAYHNNINLPVIQLYKLGSLYFIRDGNHRVSVAKALGVAYIDAEITELSAKIKLQADWSIEQIKEAVVAFERTDFLAKTHLGDVIDMNNIIFTKPGSYEKLLNHIMVHKYYLNEKIGGTISLAEAASSWYSYIYMPIILIIEKNNFFNLKNKADLYLTLVNQWEKLKKQSKEAKVNQAVKALKHKKRR